MITRPCQHCNKLFETYQHRIDEGRGKFCSKRCFYAFRRASRPRTAACEQCGKTFPAKPHRIERGEAKYCSHACFRHAREKDLNEYFWSLVRKSESCWLWTGPVNSGNGYGRFSFRSEQIYAHRTAYELANGPIPKGQHVCHTCDTPLCVRPEHLFLGTPQNNMDDRDDKGRVRHGERHENAKLTGDDVRAIRKKYADGNTTFRALAQAYNISHQNISDIIHRRTWKRVS